MSHEHGETGNWRIPKPGKSVTIPFATVGALLSVLAVGQQAWSWYQERQKAAIQHALEEKALRDRLAKIERWKCVLGWNPPETRDANRKCPAAVEDGSEP